MNPIPLELSTRRRLSQVAASTRPVTSMDPLSGQWVVSGLASPEEYTAIFREFVFKNDGPVVRANGHLNRTVWLEVEDELGAKVRTLVILQPPPHASAWLCWPQGSKPVGTGRCRCRGRVILCSRVNFSDPGNWFQADHHGAGKRPTSSGVSVADC